MKVVIVCAGGPHHEIMDFDQCVKDEAIFIGADRGTLHLLEKGIVPDEAVGDFDSVTAEEYETIIRTVHVVGQFRSEKDETDTELAMERALSYGPAQIILTGVTGGRLDHAESALHLLYRLQIKHPKITFSIRNQLNEFMMLLPKVHEVESDKRFPFVSFFPFGGPVKGLTLTGFKYETVDALLETGMTKFTSNELAARSCTISFLEGICLMVRSADA